PIICTDSTKALPNEHVQELIMLFPLFLFIIVEGIYT
ncbi:MAG: hypothetical protein ACI90V_012652, partial [Bacillariaceae sp.]